MKMRSKSKTHGLNKICYVCAMSNYFNSQYASYLLGVLFDHIAKCGIFVCCVSFDLSSIWVAIIE